MIQAQSYARQLPGLETQPQTRTRMVRRTYSSYNAKRAFVIKTGIILFAYALLLVYLCIKSATLGYQIVDLQKQINTLETDNKRIEYQIANATSLERVEEYAVKELGMCKPEADSMLQIAARPEITRAADSTHNLSQEQTTTANKPLAKFYQTIAVMVR